MPMCCSGNNDGAFYVLYYNHHRPHQALDGNTDRGAPELDSAVRSLSVTLFYYRYTNISYEGHTTWE